MQITLKNQLLSIAIHMMGTCMMLACAWFYNFDPDLIFIFLCFWLLYTIPVLYLHIEYFIKNRRQQIEISADEITIRKNAQVVKYKSDELANITTFKSAALDKGGIQFLAMDSYYFSRITTKNEEEIVITCLMSRKADEEVRKLSGVTYEREKVPFCTLLWR